MNVKGNTYETVCDSQSEFENDVVLSDTEPEIKNVKR